MPWPRAIYDLQFGRINVHDKDQVWIRYYQAGGLWQKKRWQKKYFQSVWLALEFAITATCFDQKMLLQKEQIWDAIVSSLHVFRTDNSGLQGSLDFLSQPARLSDMPKRSELCEQALVQVSRLVDPELWAGVQLELAIEPGRKTLFGSRDENIEKSIDHYRQVLEVYTRQTHPEEWASVQTNLASNYRNRQHGDRSENIETAIHLCQQALEVFTEKSPPGVNVALIITWQMHTATAYKASEVGTRNKAIFHYQQAPGVLPRKGKSREMGYG